MVAVLGYALVLCLVTALIGVPGRCCSAFTSADCIGPCIVPAIDGSTVLAGPAGRYNGQLVSIDMVTQNNDGRFRRHRPMRSCIALCIKRPGQPTTITVC